MRKKLKTILATVTVFSIITIPTFAIIENKLISSGNGTASDVHYGTCGLTTHEIGVKRLYNGEDTYGYSYVNPNGTDYCWTTLNIGGATYATAYGPGYAQTAQDYKDGKHDVSESHGRG